MVRLGGYHSQRANTVDVLGAHHRVTLLVVEPEASAENAHAALMAAGHRGNTDDVQTLLRSGPLPAEVPGGRPGESTAAFSLVPVHELHEVLRVAAR